MIPSGTRDWNDTWPSLARRLKRKWSSHIRQTAYDLRDRGFLRIRPTGRGVVITLRPEDGQRLFFESESAPNAGTQSASNAGTQTATKSGHSECPQSGHLDRGLNMKGRTPRKRPPSKGGPKEDRKVQEGAKASGPPSPLSSASGENAANGVHRRPATASELISADKKLDRAQDELGRVERRLKEIENGYECHQDRSDWTSKDRTQHAELSRRRKELKAILGWKV